MAKLRSWLEKCERKDCPPLLLHFQQDWGDFKNDDLVFIYPWSDKRQGYVMSYGSTQNLYSDITWLLLRIAHMGEMPELPFSINDLVIWIENAPVKFT